MTLFALLRSSTPITGTITPARNVRSCPVLDLDLQPIHLSLLGLNVNTSAICPVTVRITATPGGGVLGNLLSGITGGNRRTLLRGISSAL
jgi:hypothetical protein